MIVLLILLEANSTFLALGTPVLYFVENDQIILLNWPDDSSFTLSPKYSLDTKPISSLNSIMLHPFSDLYTFTVLPCLREPILS